MIRSKRPAAPLTRQSTQGPLDIADPLASEIPPTSLAPAPEAAAIPIPPTPSSAHPIALSPQTPLPARSRSRSPAPAVDLSFLLRPENFHPIPQGSIPPPFRSTPAASFTNLPLLLRQGNYIPAAILTVKTLTTAPSLPPQRILTLLYTRLACLAVSGHETLAAQESLIFGDIHSPFYFSTSRHDDDGNSCILSWSLRLLLARLQALAVGGDPRGAVQSYYDFGAYARSQYKRSSAPGSKDLWKRRLRDLGYRTGNSLVAMGDLEGARHLYESFISRAQGEEEKAVLEGWVAMLCIRMGDLEGAKRWIDARLTQRKDGVLDALFVMAEGREEEAVAAWRGLLGGEYNILARHNLAVCLIYTGALAEATDLMEEMVDAGNAFHALTFNLATVYELRTEQARERKTALAKRVADHLRQGAREDGKSVEMVNGDFKL